MPHHLQRREFVVGGTLTAVAGPALAQSGQPIRIGFSMALTGGLAPNGKSALLAQQTAQRVDQLRLLAAGAEDEFSRRRRSDGQISVARAGRDPQGYYMVPQAYAQMQVLQQAVEAVKGFDDGKLADYIRGAAFKTVLGDIKFGAKGEWAESRVLQVQFQNVKGNGAEQFKDMSTQIVVSPAEYESGELVYPYEKAK